MRWTRCRGSSLAWAASEADRAGDVNHVWTGSGFSGMWTWWRQHERDCRHTWPCRVVWSVVAFDMHTCKPHGPKRVRRFGPMSDLQLSLDRRLAWLALAPMHPSSEAYPVATSIPSAVPRQSLTVLRSGVMERDFGHSLEYAHRRHLTIARRRTSQRILRYRHDDTTLPVLNI